MNRPTPFFVRTTESKKSDHRLREATTLQANKPEIRELWPLNDSNVMLNLWTLFTKAVA
jgi:hypothetical protein